jgi:hypothetical protein
MQTVEVVLVHISNIFHAQDVIMMDPIYMEKLEEINHWKIR